MNSKTMKTFGFFQPGSKEEAMNFEKVQQQKPTATGRDLLVEVKAISVNPTDLRTRDGKKEDDKSLTVVGRDVAGVVVSTGDDCSYFKVGDEVFYAGTNNRPGGHSEFHLVDERIVGRKPTSLNFAQAAALPLTSVTAYEALFDRLGISKYASDNTDSNILIIGAAGGVGSIAVQIAKLAGLTVIGTASRPETVEWAKDHGADHTINHHEPFGPQLENLGIEGVEYIFCSTNVDDHMAEMAKAILPQGKICSILPAQKPLDMALFGKSVTFVYELMYTRSVFQTTDMVHQHMLLNIVADWVDDNKIRSTIAEHFTPISVENLNQAYTNLLTGKTIGKIVLEGPFE